MCDEKKNDVSSAQLRLQRCISRKRRKLERIERALLLKKKIKNDSVASEIDENQSIDLSLYSPPANEMAWTVSDEDRSFFTDHGNSGQDDTRQSLLNKENECNSCFLSFLEGSALSDLIIVNSDKKKCDNESAELSCLFHDSSMSLEVSVAAPVDFVVAQTCTSLQTLPMNSQSELFDVSEMGNDEETLPVIDSHHNFLAEECDYGGLPIGDASLITQVDFVKPVSSILLNQKQVIFRHRRSSNGSLIKVSASINCKVECAIVLRDPDSLLLVESFNKQYALIKIARAQSLDDSVEESHLHCIISLPTRCQRCELLWLATPAKWILCCFGSVESWLQTLDLRIKEGSWTAHLIGEPVKLCAVLQCGSVFASRCGNALLAHVACPDELFFMWKPGWQDAMQAVCLATAETTPMFLWPLWGEIVSSESDNTFLLCTLRCAEVQCWAARRTDADAIGNAVLVWRQTLTPGDFHFPLRAVVSLPATNTRLVALILDAMGCLRLLDVDPITGHVSSSKLSDSVQGLLSCRSSTSVALVIQDVLHFVHM